MRSVSEDAVEAVISVSCTIAPIRSREETGKGTGSSGDTTAAADLSLSEVLVFSPLRFLLLLSMLVAEAGSSEREVHSAACSAVLKCGTAWYDAGDGSVTDEAPVPAKLPVPLEDTPVTPEEAPVPCLASAGVAE